MKAFKRLAVTIQSRTEELIGSLENHQAVAESMIQQMKQAAAKARIHFARVQADRQRLERRLRELHDAELRWVERARRVSSTDETRALACVRRLKATREEIARVESEREQVAKADRALAADLERLERQLAELERRKNTLACRQGCVDALTAVERADATNLEDLCGAFSRWETSVMEKEIMTGRHEKPVDPVENDFAAEEEERELRSMLDDIIAAPEAGDN